MIKIIPTQMTKHYRFGLFFRLSIFIICLLSYIFHKEEFYFILKNPIRFNVAPIHILWLIFMVTMLSHLFPTDKLPMSLKKHLKKTFQPRDDYSQLELLQFVQKQNQRAWIVMLVWLLFNTIFGLLYLFHVLDNADLLMLTVFYYLCDYICIIFYCPFQSIIMKNKCCVNCRIYDWGHFMMFTPMLFIKDFFSWSLFFLSLVVLIHWELVYAKYPERFWEGSNKILQCAHCQDKTCQVKKKIAKQKRTCSQ